MTDDLSLSVFVLEVDRRPVVAFASRTHAAAEAILEEEQLRERLAQVRSGGVPLCDQIAIFRLRLAHPDEKAIYRRRKFGRVDHTGVLFAFLIEPDREEANIEQELQALANLGGKDETGES